MKFLRQFEEYNERRLRGEPFRIHEPQVFISPDRSKILSVQTTSEYTRVDVCYMSSTENLEDRWFQVKRNCHIRPRYCDRAITYKLLDAINIPIEPKEKFFTKDEQEVFYTLFFEPIPPDLEKIDIIQNDCNNTEGNFELVSLTRVDPIFESSFFCNN